MSVGAAEFVDLLLASTTTKRAVHMALARSGYSPASGAQSSGSPRNSWRKADWRLVGSQPRGVDYKIILIRRGLILCSEDTPGRKLGSFRQRMQMS